jgi:hypothetical protein
MYDLAMTYGIASRAVISTSLPSDVDDVILNLLENLLSTLEVSFPFLLVFETWNYLLRFSFFVCCFMWNRIVVINLMNNLN